MSDIVERLQASVRFNAYSGDAHEQIVCGRQMREAAAEIKHLRAENRHLQAHYDSIEKFAVRVLGREAYDNSPCQAHPLEFVEIEIERLRESQREAERDAAYLKWRLTAIIPLFQEARDALCAIPLANAKLRGLDLSLGDRMDAAGTATRADFDALMAADSASLTREAK